MLLDFCNCWYSEIKCKNVQTDLCTCDNPTTRRGGDWHTQIRKWDVFSPHCQVALEEVLSQSKWLQTGEKGREEDIVFRASLIHTQVRKQLFGVEWASIKENCITLLLFMTSSSLISALNYSIVLCAFRFTALLPAAPSDFSAVASRTANSRKKEKVTKPWSEIQCKCFAFHTRDLLFLSYHTHFIWSQSAQSVVIKVITSCRWTLNHQKKRKC